MSLRDFKISNRNTDVYEAVKSHLDEEAVYYHETPNGLEITVSDSESDLFGNQAKALADVIDASGGDTSRVRQRNGW